MTTYNAIPDSLLEPDDPITSDIGFRWRDNPIAMFEGSVGAPRLQFGALGTLVPGAVVRSRNDPVQGSSALAGATAMLFGFCQSGDIRLSADHRHGGGTTASVSILFQRWRAGVWTTLATYTIPSGTGWTARALDISVIPGDTLGVAMVGGAGGAISQVSNIRLSTDGGLLWPFPTTTPLE